MKDGEIQQIGTPTDIYNEPVNEYVANFIGESNIIDGVMIKDYEVMFEDKKFECVDFGFDENEPVQVVIRPEDIDIVKRNEGKLRGVVRSVLFKGCLLYTSSLIVNEIFLSFLCDYRIICRAF